MPGNLNTEDLISDDFVDRKLVLKSQSAKVGPLKAFNDKEEEKGE